ncbi:hypothetical protein K493DRAFT_13938 [Basidiobolus meristosporus CBS 931.73]|uniref:Uncharacterized protein n=1 Tax=Basidiobolus meristosporus CBS 931.73 TaxID=1314790 RepID=A0A1Y1VQ74_9FUNG|nr:hypothetical protein K493DRAFT_13938 [Basidiobolus meristosporus CBS 931.73]|eukprot:ORX63427.1 hypothetical protein K493DRAFT_13938 [Basidiobolus meristosporus CBS 931.73]
MAERTALLLWLSVVFYVAIAPLVKADLFLMQCQVNSEGLKNLLASDRCDLNTPNTPWVFQKDSWTMFNGLCCAADVLRQTPAQQETYIELKQTIGKEKLAPFISSIDKDLMVGMSSNDS